MYIFPLLFLFIYSPFLALGGIQLKLPILIHLIFLVAGFPFAVAMYRKYVAYRVAINILLANGFLILLLFLFHGGRDHDGLRLAFSGIVTLIGAAFFVQQYRRLYNERYCRKLIFDIVLVGALHAIIILGTIMVEPFGDWMKATFFYTDKTLEVWGLRSSGLLVSGFGALSLSQAMTAILGIVLLLTDKKGELSVFSRNCVVVGLPLIFLSIVVSGRAGLVTLLFATLLFIVLNARAIYSNKRSRNILAVFILGITALVSILLSFTIKDEYSEIIKWSFELYYSYDDRGELSTGSTNIVLDSMYFFPEGFVSMLIGTGNFGRLEPALPTDVGYILMIFGAGVVGLVSMTAIFLYFAIKSAPIARRLPLVGNAVLLVTVMLFLANLKDPFFFHIYGTNQIVLILYALMTLALFDYRRGLGCRVIRS